MNSLEKNTCHPELIDLEIARIVLGEADKEKILEMFKKHVTEKVHSELGRDVPQEEIDRVIMQHLRIIFGDLFEAEYGEAIDMTIEEEMYF